MVECDVHLCKTGELIVIHDDTLGRTTNGTGKIQEKTFSELRLLDAGSGEHIPSLEEVLQIANSRVAVNVELKGSGTARPVSDLVQRLTLEKRFSRPQLLVSSFDRHELIKFRQVDTETNIGAIKLLPIVSLTTIKSIGASVVVINSKWLKKGFVNRAQGSGLKVFAWTVNDKDDFLKMSDLKVDGVITDFPDLAKKYIKSND